MSEDMNEEEKKVLLDHDYDGIQEFDFPLPRWWVATFWITSLFGIGYFVYYIVMNGPSLQYEYFVEANKVMQQREAFLEELKNFKPETYETYAGSPEMVKHGEYLFTMNCVSCHMEKGAGDIGPNLTDEYWLYSDGTPSGIYPFLIEGNPLNGMPAWGEFLEEDDLYALTAYLVSIKGTVHENPKEPQGEIPGQ